MQRAPLYRPKGKPMNVNLTKPDYRIRVVWDDDPDLSWAEDDRDDDGVSTLDRLRSGVYGVYGVIAEVSCPCCGSWDSRSDSLWGIVVNATGTGTYRYAAEIADEHLRDVARECLAQARVSA